MVSGIFTDICHHHHSGLQSICVISERNPVPFVTPLSPTPGQPLMCLVCVGLPILDTSYKWNRTIWGLPCLASFSEQCFQGSSTLWQVSTFLPFTAEYEYYCA